MRPRVLPIVIVGSLLLAIDGTLWYFVVNADSKDRGAFIGAASAWGVVVVGILVAWIRALISEFEKFKAERRTAYTGLLSSFDDFIVAQSRFNDANAADKAARSDLDAAEKRLQANSNYANGNAVAAAEAQLDDAVKSLSCVTPETERLLDEFQKSAADASPLAPQSVQEAIAALNDTRDQNTSARDRARSNFVKVARGDLGLPSRADESAL
jgi:hypothetical protein